MTLIEAGPWGLERAREVVDREAETDGATCELADVRLHAPLRPTRLRDCIAFETHVRNFHGSVPEAFYREPVFYKGNPATVLGPGEDVRWPSYSDERDYELELGVVLGRAGVDVAVEDAESHIYGLTCFNDWSARDVLRDEVAVGMGPAKAKDFATSIGPWLVTIDEVPDLYGLDMEATGQRRGLVDGVDGGHPLALRPDHPSHVAVGAPGARRAVRLGHGGERLRARARPAAAAGRRRGARDLRARRPAQPRDLTVAGPALDAGAARTVLV